MVLWGFSHFLFSGLLRSLLILTEGTVHVQIQGSYKVRPHWTVRRHESISYMSGWSVYFRRGAHAVCTDCRSCMSPWNAFRVTKLHCLLPYYTFSTVPFNVYSLLINRTHISKQDSWTSWNLTTSVQFLSTFTVVRKVVSVLNEWSTRRWRLTALWRWSSAIRDLDMGSQLHVQADLPSGNNTHAPIATEAGWHHSRYGNNGGMLLLLGIASRRLGRLHHTLSLCTNWAVRDLLFI